MRPTSAKSNLATSSEGRSRTCRKSNPGIGASMWWSTSIGPRRSALIPLRSSAYWPLRWSTRTDGELPRSSHCLRSAASRRPKADRYARDLAAVDQARRTSPWLQLRPSLMGCTDSPRQSGVVTGVVQGRGHDAMGMRRNCWADAGGVCRRAGGPRGSCCQRATRDLERSVRLTLECDWTVIGEPLEIFFRSRAACA
jgi:hypothetical protein